MFPDHPPPAVHAEVAIRDAARAQLSREGLLDQLPSYDAFHGDLGAFARAIEAFSGFPPGSMLETSDRAIRIRPSETTQFTFEQLQRLINALWVALPADSDVQIALIASAG